MRYDVMQLKYDITENYGSLSSRQRTMQCESQEIKKRNREKQNEYLQFKLKKLNKTTTINIITRLKLNLKLTQPNQ